jgi:putative endonuclease
MIDRRKRGAEGEDLAVEYLRRLGYTIRRRNYRYHRGEIDIIAQNGETLVFVEVKTRRSTAFGDPEEAVTPLKGRRIRRIAAGFLLEENIGDRECRFDVIGVDYARGSPALRHIENAF